MPRRIGTVSVQLCLILLMSSAVSVQIASRPVAVMAQQGTTTGTAVTTVTFSKDGKSLATGHRDGEIVIWDVASKKELRKLTTQQDAAVTDVDFNLDGRTLARSGADSEVWLWDATNGTVRQRLQGHEHPVRSIAYSPDGSIIASAGDDTRVILWNGTSGKLTSILTGHTDFVTSLAFSPNSTTLVTSSKNGEVILWDTRSGKELTQLRGHAGAVNAVAFSPDGKTVATGGQDTVIRLWNVSTGTQKLALTGQAQPIRSLAFSNRTPMLVSGGDDGRALLWNLDSGKLIRALNGQQGFITSVAFSPDGSTVARGTESGKTILSNATTGIDLATFVKPPKAKQASSTATQANSTQDQTRTGAQTIAPTAMNAGPGGPILVIRSPSNPYGDYYAEMLRAEGLNAFSVVNLADVTEPLLANHSVAILAEATLTATQASILTTWVEAGGNLIAMRPDSQLAAVLGLTPAGSSLSEGYLRVDVSRAPGNGIVGDPIQFHGTADRYTLNGAIEVAKLYSNPTTATTNPAVTLRAAGPQNGHAAAFTFDLARSIVYTRQGNPAWAAMERDGNVPIRSNDKFYGAATGDPQPDWVNLDKASIPQADEQQRLLANLISFMNLTASPLPRFWFLPNGHKAAVVLTGDDHGNGGTIGQFNNFIAESPSGCSVADWECIRATSYIYASTPMTNAQAAAFEAQGFEIALHLSTGCANYSPTSIDTALTNQLATWQQKYTSLAPPSTNRNHCIAFSDWDSLPIAERARGIRLDTNYYYWPPSWVANRPGHFSGSALPMRFASQSGAIIDVYQVATQMTDESGQLYPFTIDELLDSALGQDEFYGVYTVNAHTDANQSIQAQAVIDSAQARSVPVISARQLLTWLDGRNSSSFANIAWDGTNLTFEISAGPGAVGLEGMAPFRSANGVLTTVTRDGNPVSFDVRGVKGVEYAMFSAESGSYVATYTIDVTAPSVTSTAPANQATGVAIHDPVTANFSEAMDAATLTTGSIELRDSASALVSTTLGYSATSRRLTVTPDGVLTANKTYTLRVKGGSSGVADVAGNVMASDALTTFTTAPATQCPCSLWPSSMTPAQASVVDPNPVNLGVKFQAESNGTITGIRFFKGPKNTGTHRVSLWTSSGQLLAQAVSSGETATGWQQVNFSSPVAITANTVYVASYHTTSGNYSANLDYFASTGQSNSPLLAPSSTAVGGNGVYKYGASSAFPNQTWRATNYWVDPVYIDGTPSGVDTTPPTVTGTNPQANATQIGTSTTVTATFDEAIDPATLTSTTFQLRDGANVLVSAAVSYNALTRTTTLTPAAALAEGVNYTATVTGGAGGVKDLAGNALAADYTWSFRTASPSGCPCSLWNGTTVPGLITENDPGAVELGVKFQATTNGAITGLRFYKGPQNTGTHTGSLWTLGGQLLAQATFTNETASGWQQVTFSTPVAITANTVYVASYHTTSGFYSQNASYFATSGWSSGPLHALQSGVVGGNGVYRYGATPGFPSQSWNASNYWIDVIYVTP